ncbi:TrbG/VirB9 family P-type conjugative transfer protein [Acidithiobacillus caldus]|uniref:TrbG/VirB9 family P-type conjugative transfer protein n=1 Tax=Acidithiobacillus caldus TaxID=33059 RepID=UPI0007F49E1F|nr:TrbG/VirB9 family P-type conjugative transfer protein [Acidithiobacillus caldus]QER45259.1 hypothetical protein F0726_02202 [Acidithiobacillus caldus]
MKNYRLRKTVIAAVLVAAGIGTAVAGVDVPPLQGTGTHSSAAHHPNLPPKTPANQAPAALNPNAQPAAKRESSTEIWQQTVAAPPAGRIQSRSLASMQKALVSAYEAGKLQSLPPIAGSNGEILYAYGNSLPTLVTAPLHTSIIQLEPGCHPALATGAPASEWVVHTVMAGNQPELTVMPKFTGLHTDLVIPATSASGKPMNYVIELTSDARKYTPMIGFYYPNRDIRTWNAQAAVATAAKQKAAQETVAELPNLSVSDLDFRWKMRCAGGGWFSDSDCRSIEPVRVFDDGTHTYIQFKPDQASHGGIPSILAENSAGKPAIINAQFRDGYYIVDSVPDKILLIAGKGSSGKVVKIVKGD